MPSPQGNRPLALDASRNRPGLVKRPKQFAAPTASLLMLIVMASGLSGCMGTAGSAAKPTQTLVLTAETRPASAAAPAPSTVTPAPPPTTAVPVPAPLVAQLPGVPVVAGKTQSAATRILKAAGYAVSVVREEAFDGVTGTVLRTSPEAGSALAPGSRVTLVVLQVVVEEEPAGSNCTPGYDPCLPPASDYDCAGGSGNGPKYVEGPVRVTGSDPYRLDADHDGIGCER